MKKIWQFYIIIYNWKKAPISYNNIINNNIVLSKIINLNTDYFDYVKKYDIEKIRYQNDIVLLKLKGIDDIDEALANKLIDHGIKTADDLAEQATDDITDIEGLDAKKAGEIIMAARNECWFKEPQA